MIIETFMTFLSRIFFFTSFVNNNGSFPKPLPAAEERMYFDRYKKNGDREAYDLLVRHNLRLVAHIVKKYNNAGEADDLISVGSIGLIKGIETFEPNKGCQLTTYAAKCIENEILMYIRANKKHRQAVSLYESVGTDKEGNDIALMDVIPQQGDGYAEIENSIVLEKVKEVMNKVLSDPERANTIASGERTKYFAFLRVAHRKTRYRKNHQSDSLIYRPSRHVFRNATVKIRKKMLTEQCL